MTDHNDGESGSSATIAADKIRERNMASDDPCLYCHGAGKISDQNPYTYAPQMLSRPCDCIPRDPPTPPISSDDLLYGPILARGIER